MEHVDTGVVLWADPETNARDIQDGIERWASSHADVLARFRLRVARVVVAQARPALADGLVTAAAPASVEQRAAWFFRLEDITGGVEYLNRAAAALEAAQSVDESVGKRVALADAYQRLGFFHALLGNANEAEAALRRVAQTRGDYDWADKYNLAYVRALRREYAAAASLVRTAGEDLALPTRSYVLLLFLPAPRDVAPASPKFYAATTVAHEIRDLMLTQALVYDALAGRFSRAEFFREVTRLGDDLTVAQLRLLGWTALIRYDVPRQAHLYFSLAAKKGSLEATAELEIVSGQVE